MGNNFPVFFVRDGMKFPDMVPALKPNPKTNIQEGWRIADFFSHIPESMHMVSLLASCHGRGLLICQAPNNGSQFMCIQHMSWQATPLCSLLLRLLFCLLSC